MKHGRWLTAASVCWALQAVPRPAAAAPTAPPGGEPTEGLTYSAPLGCPDRASWLERVAARADGHGEAAERLVARLQIEPSGTAALLRFRGDPSERVLTGRDCREVSEAAALIVAIAARGAPPEAQARPAVDPLPGRTRPSQLEGAAESSPAPPPASLPVPPRVSPPAAPAVAPLPGAPRARPLTAAAPEPDAGALPSAQTELPGRWALGMGAEANGWLLPGPAPVFDAALDLTGASSAWSGRVGAAFASTRHSVGARSAEFRYWGARLELCPLALWRERGWRWAACSTAQLGVTRAWGDERSALAVSTPRTSPLAGLELRTRLQAPLGPARIEAEAGLGVPLLRQSFSFGAPVEQVFDSPRVGLIARAGIQVPLAGVLD